MMGDNEKPERWKINLPQTPLHSDNPISFSVLHKIIGQIFCTEVFSVSAP
jgi:hypothetical protein